MHAERLPCNLAQAIFSLQHAKHTITDAIDHHILASATTSEDNKVCKIN